MWPQVQLEFKLWPPVLKRAAGRPRSRRIKSVAEGGSRKRKKCKRCGKLGHMQKTCNETVYDSDDPPPAQPKPKRAKKEKVPASTSTPKNKRAKKEKVPASTSTPKSKRTKKEKVPASTSTPKSKRTKKEKVSASPSTSLKLQHAPTAPSSPFDLNYSPGALTRR
ncbi:hypothetical protein PVAP13_3KG519301 [Panicum virgatum]|uniref:CCHC-type domain-containing protein n=1 Tax=Panicum virgatum TaxID=38727 RepID=A0A8T0V766_PANVG|nr:hypothetical protein PVAP13_3KG519301 [Panicum virgatum]